MSYDIYCYKSRIGKPDDNELDAAVAADEDKWAKKERDAATKLAIVKALIAYNPKLEANDFQYGPVAELTVDIIEKETRRFDHISINGSDEDGDINIVIYDNHVYITLTYGYTGEKAVQLFDDIKAYVRIIRETAGYFVSDPQTGNNFDPLAFEFDGLAKYLSTH